MSIFSNSHQIITPPSSFSDSIPLILLAGVLGLPGVLIVISTFKVVYVGWMMVYLVALPIWNLVLPVSRRRSEGSVALCQGLTDRCLSTGVCFLQV